MRYSTFGARFGAGIIDGFVLTPIGMIDFLVFDIQRPIWLVAIWAFITYFFYSAYSIILHGKYGQTVGKMATGVTVLDVSETRLPGYRQAFLRDSIYIALTVVPLFAFWYYLFTGGIEIALSYTWVDAVTGYIALGWFMLEVVTMLSNEKRRALHDWIANTVVVNGKPKESIQTTIQSSNDSSD